MDLKSNKIGKLRPEGRPPSVLRTGPAECADLAEALELARSIVQNKNRKEKGDTSMFEKRCPDH